MVGTEVKVRVQTNSLPNHCYFANITAMKERNLDFEVNFMYSKTIDIPKTSQKDVLFTKDYNSVVCALNKEGNS